MSAASRRGAASSHALWGLVALSTWIGLLGGCGAAPTSDPHATPEAATQAGRSSAGRSPVHYTLSADATLERLTETVCSEGPWTDRVVSIHAEARTRLVAAHLVEPGVTDRPLDVGRTGRLAIDTHALSPHACLRLVFDLASSGGGMSGCLRAAQPHAEPLTGCATSAWLVAAEPWREGARHRVTLALPEGVTMSPIFGRDELGLYLDARALRYVGYAGLGALEAREVPVPGGCATLLAPSSLFQTSHLETSHLEAWVARAGLASAFLTGVASAEGTVVTALPWPGTQTEPVRFGVAGRGSRPSVLALVSERPGPALERDWTLVHELVHLAMPYVATQDAWLSEGLATYYQEVLRARVGMQSPEDAWRALDHGFVRVRSDGASLRQSSAEMHTSRAYTRVYWGGAALALTLDVALRSEGLGTLDARLARLWPRRGETLTAEAFVAALDDDSGRVRAIVARALDAPGAPALGEVYAALGLTRGPEGRLQFTAESPLREAIMNQPSAPSSNGPCPSPTLAPRAADVR